MLILNFHPLNEMCDVKDVWVYLTDITEPDWDWHWAQHPSFPTQPMENIHYPGRALNY